MEVGHQELFTDVHVLTVKHMPAGKATDTIARTSKSSRLLKQKFSHTRKTQKNEAVDN